MKKVPILNSLLPILSELAPSQNYQNALTSVTVPQISSQTPPDELVLQPVLIPKLQMETTKPPTTIPVLYQPPKLKPLPTTSTTSTNYTSKPLSLEMFNCVATNLNKKGVINLKRYKKYLHQHQKKMMDPAFMFGHLDPANLFAMEGLNMALAAKLNREGKPLPKLLFIDVMVEKTQKTN